MVYSLSKDGIKRVLIFQNTILLVDKEDELFFEIDNQDLKFTIQFLFSSDGDAYSTTYWENIDNNFLKFQLNKWDSNNWVEISKPVPLKVMGSQNKYWLKFRNNSQVDHKFRKFEISIWKEEQNG